jgi:hypothetical protein
MLSYTLLFSLKCNSRSRSIYCIRTTWKNFSLSDEWITIFTERTALLTSLWNWFELFFWILQLLSRNPSTINHTLTVLLHNGDDKKCRMIDLCKCALADDVSVMVETCSGLCILKQYCNSNELCPIVGLYCESWFVLLLAVRDYLWIIL